MTFPLIDKELNWIKAERNRIAYHWKIWSCIWYGSKGVWFEKVIAEWDENDESQDKVGEHCGERRRRSADQSPYHKF